MGMYLNASLELKMPDTPEVKKSFVTLFYHSMKVT